MANIHPKEKELFAEIEAAHVSLSTEMWAYIYSVISEYLTSTRFILEYYQDLKESVSRADLEKMGIYVSKMIEHFRKIYYPEHLHSHDVKLVKIIQESKGLHLAVKELMGHYLGNDLNIMSLIIGSYLERDKEAVITLEDMQRISISLNSISEFLEKLRYATINIETIVDKIRNKLQFPVVYLSHLSLHKNVSEINFDKISRCCDNLQEIKNLLDKCK
ncbi:MAG: hypothetical protein HQL26_03750 [Candidatus Omnitrophica bacterium]|nr:hypothetical protein [Candidatus Omnitrophota bacterium]